LTPALALTILGRMPAPAETTLAALREVLARRPEILEAYVFGSFARGEAQPHSDLDVAVYLASPSTEGLGADAEIAADLMHALGSDRVDVVVLNQAPPLLYHRVLRDGVRLFARDLAATSVREGRALSRYCDYIPQLAKIRAARAQRSARGEFGR
jgi:predicted nucleotidyltransferase